MTELSLSLQSSRISYQPHCDPTNQLNASNNKLDDDITQDDDDCYQEARMSLNVQVINTSIIFPTVPHLVWSADLSNYNLLLGSHRRGPLQVGQHRRRDLGESDRGGEEPADSQGLRPSPSADCEWFGRRF